MKFKHQHRMGKRGSGAMPNNLFGDSDRDGVPNVFDCKPHNKRRQDVMAPLSGGNPMGEMYRRQEAVRQQRIYARQLAEWQRQQEQQQQTPPIIIYNTEYIDRTSRYPSSGSGGSGSKAPTQVGMGYGGGSNEMRYSGAGSGGSVTVNVVPSKNPITLGGNVSKIPTVSAPPKSSGNSILSSMAKSAKSAISKGISGLGAKK